MKTIYKKVKTLADIKADPRIDKFYYEYDGYGRHMVACKTGWNFERERTIDIGNMKEICDAINFYLESNEENGYEGQNRNPSRKERSQTT